MQVFELGKPNARTRNNTEPPITDLIHRNDEESLHELIQHYRPLLYAIANREWDRRLSPRNDPSDAVQWTWASVAQRTGELEFTNRKQFSRYIRKTLVNHIRSLKRRFILSKKRTSEMETDRSLSDVLGIEIDPGKGGGLPEEVLLQKEFLQAILKAIFRLPKELQRLLRWRFRRGLTYPQIAEKLGRTPDEVRRLVDKCLSDLSSDLKNQFSNCPSL